MCEKITLHRRSGNCRKSLSQGAYSNSASSPVANRYVPCHKGRSMGKQKNQEDWAYYTHMEHSLSKQRGLNGTPGPEGEGGLVIQNVALHFISCYWWRKRVPWYVGMCSALELIRECSDFNYLCKWISKIKCTVLRPKLVLIYCLNDLWFIPVLFYLSKG